MIPFHKQLDKDKQAGQIVFSPPVPNTQPELYLSDSHKQETTLAQYIERKTDAPERLTFATWWALIGKELHGDYYREVYEEVWTIALTKGKL